MSPRTKSETTRQRIIDTAFDLFYRQGYHSTGINQIIEEAEISKPTMYSYFNSKEELCVEYLRERRRRDGDEIQKFVAKLSDPVERFMAPIVFAKEFVLETDFRGCGFMNLAAEIADPESPIRGEVVEFNEALLEIYRELTEELKSSSARYKHLDPVEIARRYLVILSGAIATASEYREEWPLELAIEQVASLIKK